MLTFGLKTLCMVKDKEHHGRSPETFKCFFEVQTDDEENIEV